MTELEKFYEERSKAIKQWKQYPDYFGKNKKIGKNKITLLAGKNRGGVIFIYSHMSSKDDNLNLFEEVHFMNWENAADEYKNLKSTKSVLNLINRNN